MRSNTTPHCYLFVVEVDTGGPSVPITWLLPGLGLRAPPGRDRFKLKNLDLQGAKSFVSWSDT
jgi:hypothetical protein